MSAKSTGTIDCNRVPQSHFYDNAQGAIEFDRRYLFSRRAAVVLVPRVESRYIFGWISCHSTMSAFCVDILSEKEASRPPCKVFRDAERAFVSQKPRPRNRLDDGSERLGRRTDLWADNHWQDTGMYNYLAELTCIVLVKSYGHIVNL